MNIAFNARRSLATSLLTSIVRKRKSPSNWMVLSIINQKETQKDLERTNSLAQYQTSVIRIPNNEVMYNFRGVCEYIDLQVRQSLSHLVSVDTK